MSSHSAVIAARQKRLAKRCGEVIVNATTSWDVADGLSDLDAEFPGLGFMAYSRQLTATLERHLQRAQEQRQEARCVKT